MNREEIEKLADDAIIGEFQNWYSPDEPNKNLDEIEQDFSDEYYLARKMFAMGAELGYTKALPKWVEKLEAIRKAFVWYYDTEGCSCCQNVEGHKQAEKALAELLGCNQYNDGSGFDWYRLPQLNEPPISNP